MNALSASASASSAMVISECGPPANIPERIVLCIDLSNELLREPVRLTTLKDSIMLFVNEKLKMSSMHSFAIVWLHSEATWAYGFSNDPIKIASMLNDMDSNLSRSSVFCLDSIFTTVQEHVSNAPLPTGSHVYPINYIIRVVIIYMRSDIIPRHMEGKENAALEWNSNPGHFTDILFLHERISDNGAECQAVFDALTEAEVADRSYVFESSFQSVKKTIQALFSLLGHPLQRPPQSEISTALSRIPNSNDMNEVPVMPSRSLKPKLHGDFKVTASDSSSDIEIVESISCEKEIEITKP